MEEVKSKRTVAFCSRVAFDQWPVTIAAAPWSQWNAFPPPMKFENGDNTVTPRCWDHGGDGGLCRTAAAGKCMDLPEGPLSLRRAAAAEAEFAEFVLCRLAPPGTAGPGAAS